MKVEREKQDIRHSVGCDSVKKPIYCDNYIDYWAMENCPHLVSICFTVPVIWLIFSSRRVMASLFCLELASAH